MAEAAGFGRDGHCELTRCPISESISYGRCSSPGTVRRLPRMPPKKDPSTPISFWDTQNGQRVGAFRWTDTVAKDFGSISGWRAFGDRRKFDRPLGNHHPRFSQRQSALLPRWRCDQVQRLELEQRRRLLLAHADAIGAGQTAGDGSIRDPWLRQEARARLLRADLEDVLAEREPGSHEHLGARQPRQPRDLDFTRGKAFRAAHVLLKQAPARDRAARDGDQHEAARDPGQRPFATLEHQARARAAVREPHAHADARRTYHVGRATAPAIVPFRALPTHSCGPGQSRTSALAMGDHRKKDAGGM